MLCGRGQPAGQPLRGVGGSPGASWAPALGQAKSASCPGLHLSMVKGMPDATILTPACGPCTEGLRAVGDRDLEETFLSLGGKPRL